MKTEIKRDHVGKESLNKCFDWFQIRFLREAIKNCQTLDIVQTMGGGLSKHQLFTSMNVWTDL